jgi:hypothetical protein
MFGSRVRKSRVRATAWRRVGLACVIIASAMPTALMPASARADGPDSGPLWVVSMGDSFISGEAGRWAGNTNDLPSWIDALGPDAYAEPGLSTERLFGCHRSRSAEIHIGGFVNSLNLACSGATTTSVAGKPGVDFAQFDRFDPKSPRNGQALQLREFAKTHNVRMIVLSVGGNNFNFPSIVERCLMRYLSSSWPFRRFCKDDADIQANFSATNIETQRVAIQTAISNVRTAMRDAGYQDSQFTVVVQNYPSPLPPSGGMRISQSLPRQAWGGCGLWDADIDWANNTALATINRTVRNAAGSFPQPNNIRTMDISQALVGHRLCEVGVGHAQNLSFEGGFNPARVDKVEWVNQIRTATTIWGPYQVAEGFHPNFWAQKALRNCVRQVFNGGDPRGGTCVPGGGGVTGLLEPRMTLQ